MRNGGDTGRERGREGERENTRLGGGAESERDGARKMRREGRKERGSHFHLQHVHNVARLIPQT